MSVQSLRIRLLGLSVLVSVERARRTQDNPLPITPHETGQEIEHRAAHRHPAAVMEAHVGMPMRR